MSSSVPLFTSPGGATPELSPSAVECPADLHDGARIPFEHATAAYEHAFAIFEQAKADFAHSKTAPYHSYPAFNRSKTDFSQANVVFERSIAELDLSNKAFEDDFTHKTPCFSLKARTFARS